MCKGCNLVICSPRCPNYVLPKSQYHCIFCEEGIYEGEEYIKNIDGEYRHYDCFGNIRELLEWAGCEIGTMEDTYEGNY